MQPHNPRRCRRSRPDIAPQLSGSPRRNSSQRQIVRAYPGAYDISNKFAAANPPMAGLGSIPESAYLLEALLQRDSLRAGSEAFLFTMRTRKAQEKFNTELANFARSSNSNKMFSRKERNPRWSSIAQEDLRGLSDNQMASCCPRRAKAEHKEGKFRLFNWQNTTRKAPALGRSAKPQLRERIMQNLSARQIATAGEFDIEPQHCDANRRMLRAEKAKLLGLRELGRVSARRPTAHDVPSRETNLLSDLRRPAVANGQTRSGRTMQKIVEQAKGGFQIASWDLAPSIRRKFARRRYGLSTKIGAPPTTTS